MAAAALAGMGVNATGVIGVPALQIVLGHFWMINHTVKGKGLPLYRLAGRRVNCEIAS